MSASASALYHGLGGMIWICGVLGDVKGLGVMASNGEGSSRVRGGSSTERSPMSTCVRSLRARLTILC